MRMKFLEETTLSSCPSWFKPIFWVHYVDDIFILFFHDDDLFSEPIEFVNSQIRQIKYTSEQESEHKLPLLDVLVFHNPNTKKFKFSVYQQLTNAELYAHFYSYHSIQIKKNIVNMAVRALGVCDP